MVAAPAVRTGYKIQSPMPRNCQLCLHLLCLWAAATATYAAGDGQPGRDWPFCPAPPEIPARPTVEEELAAGDIHVLAERVDLTDQGISHLVGNVQMTRDRQQVTAALVDYERPRTVPS